MVRHRQEVDQQREALAFQAARYAYRVHVNETEEPPELTGKALAFALRYPSAWSTAVAAAGEAYKIAGCWTETAKAHVARGG